MTENSTEQLKETSIIFAVYENITACCKVLHEKFRYSVLLSNLLKQDGHVCNIYIVRYSIATCLKIERIIAWTINHFWETKKATSLRFHWLWQIMKKVTCLVGESASSLVDTKFAETRSRKNMNGTRLLLKDVCYDSSKNWNLHFSQKELAWWDEIQNRSSL